MCKKTALNTKLFYFLDILFVVAIAYFLYHGFSNVSAQQKKLQSGAKEQVKAIKDKTTRSAVLSVPNHGASSPQGIDVSHYQGQVQWDRVESQYQFAFIKATEGTHYTDPKYDENIHSIADTSLLFGAYHFFSPDQDALTQAKHFIKTTGDVAHPLPPVLDVEVNPSDGSESLRAAVKIWLKHVEQQTGCRPIIYTNRNYWSRHFDASFNDYPLWISEYTTAEDRLRSIPWSFWQFTERGRVAGVSGLVDKSRFRGDVTQLDSLSCS
ncbi:glycoside hydrolase family 25 protein [Candidatus Sororendozoicomonas aggregata]|uniref:glycoside hydrolase family 25 protein n=1 Tax=Candidatus Sororendozoicomonas aggregata TaxID=3073239 RepID=UPI002ECFCFBF